MNEILLAEKDFGVHEECGIFGVTSPEKAPLAREVYYGLFALQHRGQESAGIAVNMPDRKIAYYKNMGLDSKAKTEAMEILRRDPADSTALSVMAGYSEFYDTIDSEETTKEDLMKERPWSVPPELYDPLRIYRGEGLISWT